MADFKNYDPGRIIVTWNGIQLTGFMDGTFVSVERNVDAFEVHVGAAGDGTRVRSRNRSGNVTVTLKAESPTNDLLSAKVVEDEEFGTAYGELMVKDLNGNTVIEAPNAWLKRQANAEYADSATGREWMIECHELRMFNGGSLV